MPKYVFSLFFLSPDFKKVLKGLSIFITAIFDARFIFMHLPDCLLNLKFIDFSSLQRTLGELKELQKHQEQLFYQQEKLRAEQATFSTKVEQRLQYEEQKLREALEARGKTQINKCQLDPNVDSECVEIGSVLLKMTWKINEAGADEL